MSVLRQEWEAISMITHVECSSRRSTLLFGRLRRGRFVAVLEAQAEVVLFGLG